MMLVLLVWSGYYFLSYVNVQPNDSISSSDKVVTVMSYNAMMGVQMVNNKHVMSKDKKQAFINLIDRAPVADVICIQEVNEVVETMLHNISAEYPHRYHRSNKATMILSKYPIRQSGDLDFGSKVNSCLWADIGVDGETIRVYSAHLESNRLSDDSHRMLTEQEDYEHDKAVSGIWDIVTKYYRYSSVRADQADMIYEHASTTELPVIISGDFNDPPMSYVYRRFMSDYTDSFRAKGAGIGTTWSGRIPLLRIDYILSNRLLEVKSFEVLKSGLSDHYPIKSVFELK